MMKLDLKDKRTNTELELISNLNRIQIPFCKTELDKYFKTADNITVTKNYVTRHITSALMDIRIKFSFNNTYQLIIKPSALTMLVNTIEMRLHGHHSIYVTEVLDAELEYQVANAINSINVSRASNALCISRSEILSMLEAVYHGMPYEWNKNEWVDYDALERKIDKVRDQIVKHAVKARTTYRDVATKLDTLYAHMDNPVAAGLLKQVLDECLTNPELSEFTLGYKNAPKDSNRIRYNEDEVAVFISKMIQQYGSNPDVAQQVMDELNKSDK